MKILKISKFWNCSLFRYSAPFASLSIFILPFHIYFISYCGDTRKFGHSTFARSLIFKFEISAILKFCCSKFWALSFNTSLYSERNISQQIFQSTTGNLIKIVLFLKGFLLGSWEIEKAKDERINGNLPGFSVNEQRWRWQFLSRS